MNNKEFADKLEIIIDLYFDARGTAFAKGKLADNADFEFEENIKSLFEDRFEKPIKTITIQNESGIEIYSNVKMSTIGLRKIDDGDIEYQGSFFELFDTQFYLDNTSSIFTKIEKQILKFRIEKLKAAKDSDIKKRELLLNTIGETHALINEYSSRLNEILTK